MLDSNQASLSENWDQEQLSRGASFLQSLEWGQFQKSVGAAYFLLQQPGWSCLMLHKRSRFGSYLFAPYGPTLGSASELAGCLEELQSFGRQTGADWLKIEPIATAGELSQLKTGLASFGAYAAVRESEPSLTRLVDLTPSQDELLASISQSTRSFIRKSQREDLLNFMTSDNPSDMSIFAKMIDSVAQRNKIGVYSETYYSKQAQIMMPAGMMHLELALDGPQPVAAAVIHGFGPNASYTYAASTPEARDKNASAVLLWQSMLNAKARGLKTIDLFGISPDDAPPSHPWYGFSSFKKKFGGRIVEWAGTWEVPLTKKYTLYRSAQTANKHIKRLGIRL